ncbi:MAG: phosphoribosylformylglycinamidine synthase subunit PurS [Nitrospirota bacterium]
MKAKVYVTLKDSIHDPQGVAILQALSSLGFNDAKDVRAGKYFEVELSEQAIAAAEESVKQMCEKLLANTVIEKYRYEIVSGQVSNLPRQ